MPKKIVTGIFLALVLLTLLTPFWVFKDLLFPFVTSKAFFLRIVIELALPFYVYLLFSDSDFKPSIKNPLTLSVLAFLLFNVIAAFFGVNPLRSFWGNFERMGGVFYLAHLVMLYFYVLMIGQISGRYFRVFLQAVVAIGTVVSLDAVMVWLTHNNFLLTDPSYPRVSGTFGNPIFIAGFLIFPIFIGAFFAVGEDLLWKRVAYWALVLLQVWTVFLSGTRGAVVGLGVAIFIAAVLYVFLTPKKKLRLWGGSAVVLFGVVVGLLFIFHNQLPQGTMVRRVFNLRDSNTEARLIQWGVALRGFKDRPVLGVGPENYYIIANQYYNPKIYVYDPSWFDKPHNYPLEILVTSGVLGFAAYLATLIFSIWALWIGYKKGIILLGEFCILICGLVAYEVQNLTVFDTVAASMTFFIFLGFSAYIWHEAYKKDDKNKKNRTVLSPAFGYTVFGLFAVFAVYMLYAANIVGMEVAKAVNYGYAYAAADPQKSESYFERVKNLPFNFDPIQSASKYTSFANALISNPGAQTNDYVKQVTENAIDYEQSAINTVPNDPTAYQELVNLYLNYSLFTKTALNPKAIETATEATKLAPLRPEPQQTLAQLNIAQNNIPAAEAILEAEARNIPQNSNVKFQLALLYNYTGRTEEALRLVESMLSAGIIPINAREIDWMGQDYVKKNDFINAARIYELALKIEPSNIQDAFQLARVYARVGQKQKAIDIANSIAAYDPTQKKVMQDFINSLK